jgi:steroid delta-isomerase-like uncharacterized protein
MIHFLDTYAAGLKVERARGTARSLVLAVRRRGVACTVQTGIGDGTGLATAHPLRWCLAGVLVLLLVAAMPAMAVPRSNVASADEGDGPPTALQVVLTYADGHTTAHHDPALFTDDAVLEVPGMAPLSGPAAIVGFLDAFYAAIGDRHVEIETAFQSASDDRVAVVGHVTGIHAGTLLGVPATDNRIDFRLSVVYEVHDGKIARVQPFFDALGLMRQLGAIPWPAAEGPPSPGERGKPY